MATRVSARPALRKRRFISEAVETTIRAFKARCADPELSWMFENCFPNTLDTTVLHHVAGDKPDTFIITGDIDAMWLRDSTAQVWPYMGLLKADPPLRTLVAGLIRRHAACVLIDPYANAFNLHPTGSYHDTDITDMHPMLHERKWELDSLCYVVRLSFGYWQATGDLRPFDDAWLQAMDLIVRTLLVEQRMDGTSPYSFRRTTDQPHDTAQGSGSGNAVRATGMVCSVFRPSDDATVFPFLIPSNLFAAQAMRQLCMLLGALDADKALLGAAQQLSMEIQAGVSKFGVVEHPVFGKVFTYEVDGFGSQLFMDDANAPSLLSLPYLGVLTKSHPVYRNTRRMVLSEWNPWYVEGVYNGVGSPHTGEGMLWPKGLVMQALTSTSKREVARCIQTLKVTQI